MVDCEWDKWTAMVDRYPHHESLYCVIVEQADLCKKRAALPEWAARRAKAFPKSYEAWSALGISRITPMLTADAPFDPAIEAGVRLELATSAYAAFHRAMEIDPESKDAVVWASIAQTQRQLAYVVVEHPTTTAERLSALRANQAAMASSRLVHIACEMDGLPDCKVDASVTCCPEAPMTEADAAREAKEIRALERRL